MKMITWRELCDDSAAVMDAVEAGEIYYVTRNGVEVAELRPTPRRRRLTREEVVQRHRRLPTVEAAQMRREAEGFFGTEE